MALFRSRFIYNILSKNYKNEKQIQQTRHSACTTMYGRKKWQSSDKDEVSQAKFVIDNPKSLINELLNPIVKSGDAVEPYVVLTPKLNSTLWKAMLHLNWPKSINFTGVHVSMHQAEKNAYLKVCELYQNLELMLEVEGEIVTINEEHVFGVYTFPVHTVFVKGIDTSPPYNFELSTTKAKDDSFPTWHSKLQVPWPFSFSVSSSGSSFQSTQYMTCLLTYMHLKTLGLLDKKNNLVINKIPKISLNKHRGSQTPTKETFAPHFEIYVDASKSGFGAYLLTKEKDGNIHWISEDWSSHFPEKDLDQGNFNSVFHEYYALVSACYTWKHKFINKRVLCWSDNMSAVMFTNRGLDTLDKLQLERYGKLYMIMIQMCAKYNINLKALHVRRVNNHAADLLSKLQVNQFKKYVPKAKLKSKKTKKLLFWKPLDDSDKPKP